MNIKIEPAALGILNELYIIEKESFGEEAFTRSQIASLLTGYNDLAFVARVDEEMAGFVIATVEFAGRKMFGHILTLMSCRVTVGEESQRDSSMRQKRLSEKEAYLIATWKCVKIILPRSIST